MNQATVLQRSLPTIVAVVVSLLLSIYIVAQNRLLNDDAYGYLHAAELFQREGLRTVLDVYGWYGYSILIALVDTIAPGDMLQSARWLNAFSYVLLVSGFIRVVTQLHPAPTVRLRWLAALVILLYPEVNEMRYYLIRDFAFWAFSLWSLSFLIEFNIRPRLSTAIAWCVCVLAAIAFRLEGLLILVCAPLLLSLPPERGQPWEVRKLKTLWSVLGVGVGLVVVLCYAAGIDLIELIGFAYRYYLPLIFNLGGSVRDTTAALVQVLFTPDNFPGADNLWHGGVIIGFAYVFTVLVNMIQALSLPLALLLAWGWLRGLLEPQPHVARPFAAYLLSAVIALTLFMFIMHFLTQRYAVLLCLVLLTQVPLLLEHLAQTAREQEFLPRFRWVLGLFCVYYAGDSLVSFGYSREYVEEAVAWTRAELPADATLYTNDVTVAYESQRVEDYDLVSRDANLALQQAESGDYLVLVVSHDDIALRDELDLQRDLSLEKSFSNERGDEIRVYQKQAYGLITPSATRPAP